MRPGGWRCAGCCSRQLPVGMVMAAAFAGALGVGVAQGGGRGDPPECAVGMKFSRLNPVTNLRQHVQPAVERRGWPKSMLPAAAMVLFGWAALEGADGADAGNESGAAAGMRLRERHTAWRSTAAWVTLAWSGLDYAVEWVSWNKRLQDDQAAEKDER